MVLGIELSERAHARVCMLGYGSLHLRGTHLQAKAQRARRNFRVPQRVGDRRGSLPPRAWCSLALRRARRNLLGNFDSVPCGSDDCTVVKALLSPVDASLNPYPNAIMEPSSRRANKKDIPARAPKKNAEPETRPQPTALTGASYTALAQPREVSQRTCRYQGSHGPPG